MRTILRPFLDRWRLCALLISAGMLAVAHGFQTFGGFAPCHLCLIQRDVYWAVGWAALAFMVIVRLPGGPRWREATCWILALGFAASVAAAVYHAGVEWKFWAGPASCTGASAGVSAADLQKFLSGAPHSSGPRCDEAAWRLGGVSMAGWNAVASLVFVILSVAAALRERSKR